MPLSAKARIEIYLPDLPKLAYENLLDTLEQELTYTFGGSITLRGLDGSYLSDFGQRMTDRINLLYTDAPFDFDSQIEQLSRYADKFRSAAFEALEEEAVLVVALKVYHAE